MEDCNRMAAMQEEVRWGCPGRFLCVCVPSLLGSVCSLRVCVLWLELTRRADDVGVLCPPLVSHVGVGSCCSFARRCNIRPTSQGSLWTRCVEVAGRHTEHPPRHFQSCMRLHASLACIPLSPHTPSSCEWLRRAVLFLGGGVVSMEEEPVSLATPGVCSAGCPFPDPAP
jgi:hypothetical protein